MSQFKQIIFACLLLVSFETIAQEEVGGFFVEPGVTYQLGNTRVDYPSPFSSSTGATKGLGISAKLGIQVADIVFAGVDGRYGMPRFTDSAFGYDADAKEMNIAPVVGVQLPFLVGLRAWASYVVAGSLDPDSHGNIDVKFDGATGYRLGAGFRVALVSLNLEYQSLRYGSATLQNAGGFTFNSNFDSVKLNQEAWIASVSFPINL